MNFLRAEQARIYPLLGEWPFSYSPGDPIDELLDCVPAEDIERAFPVPFLATIPPERIVLAHVPVADTVWEDWIDQNFKVFFVFDFLADFFKI